jgi:hypothetical protein
MMLVEFIVPEPIDLRAVARAIDDGLNEGIQMVDGHMRTVTFTWSNETKPKWKKDGPKTVGGNRVVEYKTSDTPFFWVNEGTKGPYLIPSAGAHPTGLGPFQTGFIPKTRPRVMASQQGRRFGAFVKPKRVTHPGIEAREFTTESAKIMDNKLPPLIQSRFINVKSL